MLTTAEALVVRQHPPRGVHGALYHLHRVNQLLSRLLLLEPFDLDGLLYDDLLVLLHLLLEHLHLGASFLGLFKAKVLNVVLNLVVNVL